MYDIEIIKTPTKHRDFGRRFIPAGACAYAPAVEPDDILLVDLDANSVTVDGMYLLERADDDGHVIWMGCRRFELSVLGGVNMVEPNGDLVPLTAASDLCIVGRVETVYRPVKHS